MAVDVGGTWFRVGSSCKDIGASTVQRVRSPSLLNNPGESVESLMATLLSMLDTAAPLGAEVSISLGAALDESTGTVYGSAPLWGDYTGAFPLREELRRRRPDVSWQVFNDLTCGLADFSARAGGQGARRIGYLTVSSGIAYRSADLTRREIEVDASGLQGEIGHTTAPPVQDPLLAGTPLPCDCGGHGHVASCASGPGMARMARALDLPCAERFPDGFTDELRERRHGARSLLREAVRPVAHVLRTIWQISPHTDVIGVGGGVAENLGTFYEQELTRQICEQRSYADRWLTPELISRRLRIARPGEADCLRGALLMAEGYLSVTK